MRDYVGIKPEWAAAAQGAKFDAEVALPTCFLFRAVYEGWETDLELLLLKEALRYMKSKELRVGGRSSIGMGKLKLDDAPQIREYKRHASDGLARWLARRLGKKEAAPPAEKLAWNSISKPPGKSPPGQLPMPLCTIRLQLVVQFEGPMLVKAAVPSNEAMFPDSLADSAQPETYWRRGVVEADHTPVTTAAFPNNGTAGEAAADYPDRFYLPGASLRGVLRHQALRIEKILGKDGIVSLLFGSSLDGAQRKGLLEIGDGTMNEEPELRYFDHLAIDRITSFPVKGKKFSDCALVSPAFCVPMTLRLPCKEIEAGKIKTFRVDDAALRLLPRISIFGS